ncbi:Cartilage matrix protein [Gracilariopsis chorda]|uniref:Cartilage matrix protein n=1 Tax=Gracilariopsis chorda TaxID=448386 RepID=A0A2V3ID60_9FLOR|nr:Cartilage matrix protein [Gracilariopsis chorda]|eukprot:PXF39991.1 Cartilage matrix protein [Gracilariopsis chorda]
MKTIVSFVLSVFAVSLVTAIPFESNMNMRMRLQGVRRMVERNGCNLNVCFALDGSASVTPLDYEMQKDFVQLMSAVLDFEVENSSFSAVQYGDQVSPISPLTQSIDDFNLKVHASNISAFQGSSIGKGITYCSNQLLELADNPVKIIVFGDGRETSKTDAVSIAASFKDFHPNGRLSTVGVGFPNTVLLKTIAEAGGGRLFEIDEYIDALDLVVDLFLEVCG